MGRKAKKVLGPIVTDPGAWPPIRRRNEEDQRRLQRLLDEELTAYWRAIAKDDGVSEKRHAELEARNRKEALARAEQEEMHLLQQFVANSIGPDGKKLGEKIALYVKKRDRAKREKLPANHFHKAQTVPRLQKLTLAVWDADRARAILNRVYGRTPDGYEHRTDLIVAALRSGLSKDDIRSWKKDRACPEDPWVIAPTSLQPTV